MTTIVRRPMGDGEIKMGFELAKKISKEWIKLIERNGRVGSEVYGLKVVGRDKRGTIVRLGKDAFKILHDGRNSNNFGYETKGGSSLDVGGDIMQGCMFTSPADVSTATSLTFYVSTTAGVTKHVKAVLVLHSTLAIVPNGVGTPVDVPASSAGWKTSSFATPPTLIPNTEYVLMMIPDGTVTIYYSAGAVNQRHADGSNSYASPQDPTGAFQANDKVSIYCTYTPGGAAAGKMTVQVM